MNFWKELLKMIGLAAVDATKEKLSATSKKKTKQT